MEAPCKNLYQKMREAIANSLTPKRQISFIFAVMLDKTTYTDIEYIYNIS